MRTAAEMAEYSRQHNYTYGLTKDFEHRHFLVIEQTLEPGEEAIICFTGLHNYKSMSQHDGNYAYALTQKRIIFGQYSSKGSIRRTIPIEELKDFTIRRGIVSYFLKFGTEKEIYTISFSTSKKQYAEKLCNDLNNILKLVRNHEQIPELEQKKNEEKQFNSLMNML